MASQFHRENTPPIDLDMVQRRIAERRANVAGWSPVVREIADADTDMIELLACELKIQRMANAALKAVIGPGRAMPMEPKE